MGVECSGDTSDIVFYELAQKPFVLRQDIRRQYHIELYAKFRDDIIVIIGGDSRNHVEFGHKFKSYSKYFKLKVKSISNESVVMLDLELSRSKRFRSSGLLDVAIHTKVTSQAVPLCHTSWRQPSIHRSWPVSRCIHYYRCCTSRSSYCHGVSNLISKVASADPDHPSLASLSDNLLHGTLVRQGNGKRSSRNCTRLIHPYHPGLSRLNGKLEEFRSRFADHGFEHLLPRVTWSLGAPSIARRVLKDMRIKLTSGRSIH